MYSRKEIGRAVGYMSKTTVADNNQRGVVEMSNVASLELSKKLYELSGWEDKSKGGHRHTPDAPHYDAGCLLRKLSSQIDESYEYLSIRKLKGAGDGQQYSAGYGKGYRFRADSPEDALCKLAIKLFEEGVL